MKLIYLTRSYLPSITGGTLVRSAQVECFRKHFDTCVVTPNYNQAPIPLETDCKRININYNLRLAGAFERMGIYEDYLDPWVRKAFSHLSQVVSSEDIVFATSGGELGMIKLASLLKDYSACKFVVNYHDPLDYSDVLGRRLDKKFHVPREKQEAKYLRNADLIITSSLANQESLLRKFEFVKGRVCNNYFGYTAKVLLQEKNESSMLRIAYAGNFGTLQRPEILADVAAGEKDVEVLFIGRHAEYVPLRQYAKKAKFVAQLSHEEFLNFMQRNVDVGFVSLTSDYLGACVPSKLYEYINLGLPMLGALPQGDAMDIINQNGYGIAVSYENRTLLKSAIMKLKEEKLRTKMMHKIMEDRDGWELKKRCSEVVKWLKNLSS